MTNLARAFSLLLACCAMTFAGPAPSIAGEAVPQAAPNWTGFYAGVLAGYKFGDVDPSIRLDGNWIPGDASEVESQGGRDLDDHGADLGVLFGYNHQWSNWVLGLEATAAYVWLQESNSTWEFRGPTTNQFFLSNSFETQFLVTIGPRIGFALCDWLPYVTGGLAIGDLEFTQSFYPADYSGTPLSGREHETRAGWFVGAGLQYAITPRWSARTQYQYIDLGNVGFGTEINPDFRVRNRADLTEHNAGFAIIYQF